MKLLKGTVSSLLSYFMSFFLLLERLKVSLKRNRGILVANSLFWTDWEVVWASQVCWLNKIYLEMVMEVCGRVRYFMEKNYNGKVWKVRGKLVLGRLRILRWTSRKLLGRQTKFWTEVWWRETFSIYCLLVSFNLAVSQKWTVWMRRRFTRCLFDWELELAERLCKF